MFDNSFPLRFGFRELTNHKYHHTDNSMGITNHFLALMLEGHAELVTDRRTVRVEAGDVFYIPNGCRYHSYWFGEDTVRWISIYFTDFPNPGGIRYPLQKIDAPPAASDEILALADCPSDCASLGRLYTVFASLLACMEQEPRTPEQLLAEKAAAIMRMHPEASIAEVAKSCSVSESGLYAAFRRNNTTPVHYRQHLQIEHAVKLLTSTDLTIDVIAEQAGFNSTAYFLRVLKKLTGKSTREIRGQSAL